MNFSEIKTAILGLTEAEQRQLFLELLPEIWPKISGDAACLALLKNLLDEESVKTYQQEHMDHI